MSVRLRFLLPLLATALAPAARAQETLPSGITGTPPTCLTDVRGSVKKLLTEPKRLPPPPASGLPSATIGAPATVPTIAVLDGTCADGNCPARLAASHRHDIYEVDTAAAASRFFAQHPDTRTSGWDEVVFFTTFWTTSLGGAYYMPMSNDVSGLAKTYFSELAGGEKFNLNDRAGTGSAGFLKGTVLMSDWHTCKSAQALGIPCDNHPPYDGSQRGVMGVLGQEVGHRWGSFFYFMDNGHKSDDLLGRDLSHWSYYVDSGGSPMEGNRWAPGAAGGWALEDVTHLQYSPLDLYAMGALPKEDVPPTLLVRTPSPAPCTTDKMNANEYMRCQTNASTPPAEGTTKLSGSDRLVSIDDIVASEGLRTPKFPDASRRLYLAFALLQLHDAPASLAEQQTLDTLRRAFTRAFYDGTRRRMRPITTISRRDDLGVFDFTLDPEGWTLVDGGPKWVDGAISFPLAGASAITHDSLELDTSKETALHLKLTTGRLADVTVHVRWSTEATGDLDELAFQAPATGLPAEVVIPMAGRPGWTGYIRRLQVEVAPTKAPPAGDLSLDVFETTTGLALADADGDFVPDAFDSCPAAPNTNQLDANANGKGDACEAPAGAAGDTAGGCECGAAGLPGLLGLAAVLFRRRRVS